MADLDSEQRFEQSWQRRLLPLMIRMLVGSALFFFLASFGQLVYLHSRINDSPPFDATVLKSMPDASSPRLDAVVLGLQRLRLEGALESNLVARRYHQANVLLMSRVWSHYLGFVTGMILSLVGAAFILGRLKDSGTQLSGKQEWLEFSLATASPGIAMCVLGVLLMITTIVVHHDIQTKDVAIYLGKDMGKPEVDLTPAPTPQP